VWVEPSVIQDDAGNKIDYLKTELVLLPWRYVRRATLHPKKPDKIEPIGFKPR